MNLNKDLFERWDGKKINYRLKSLALKVDLSFSYQFDEDRFMAAAKLEVIALGKIIFTENRSSRYFTTPKAYWSDFTVNGKIINSQPGSFDLCLLPFAPALIGGTAITLYLKDWKTLTLLQEGCDYCVVDKSTKIRLTSTDDKELKALKFDTKLKKNMILERA